MFRISDDVHLRKFLKCSSEHLTYFAYRAGYVLEVYRSAEDPEGTAFVLCEAIEVLDGHGDVGAVLCSDGKVRTCDISAYALELSNVSADGEEAYSEAS